MGGGSYEFSAWVRHGLGSSSEGTTPVQVSIDVGGAGIVEKLVSTYGPGDIASLDLRAVVRTSPRDRTLDFEVNRFPMVELADPGIPWLASPPAGHGRVLPWIVLIVVEDRPGASSRSLFRITMRDRCAGMTPSSPRTARRPRLFLP